MSVYLLVKQVHVTCVLLSGLGFLLRVVWMLRGSPWLRHPLTRILPHINDTLLLTAAVMLAVMSGQYPFVVPWLTAKVLALLLYIVLGSLALKEGRSRRQRLVCGLLALLTFAYIVSVAYLRDPYGFLALIVV